MNKIREIGEIGLMGLIRPIRLITLIGLIGLMTSSCCKSHDDVEPEPVQTGTAITFNGAEGEEQSVSQSAAKASREWGMTRAGKPLSDLGIMTFKVWGYKNMGYDIVKNSYDEDASTMQLVFPGYFVNWEDGSDASSTTNSSGWEYVQPDPEQTIKYWDWSAAAYRYYAVTGGLTGTPETYGPSDEYDATSFTIEDVDASPEYSGEPLEFDEDATVLKRAAIPFFSKLWFSNGNPEHYPDKEFGKPVELKFMKPFTRVRFIFIYTYPREGILIESKCFKPTTDYDPDPTLHVGIVRKGTVKITYPLRGTDTQEWFTMTKDPTDPKLLTAFTVDADPEDYSKVYPDDVPEGWYLVLPNNSQGSYTLTVEVNKRERTCTVPQQYMQWLPGYSYTYIFKILEEGGVAIDMVQSAFTPWSDMRITHEVYNW